VTRRLPAGSAIIYLISRRFTGFCQFQKFFFGSSIIRCFGKLSILGSFLSIVIRVVHPMPISCDKLYNQLRARQHSAEGIGAATQSDGGFRGANLECPLCPRKQTCAAQLGMSAVGQKRTSTSLFDHLVGLRE
jgi:hypothetical protein